MMSGILVPRLKTNLYSMYDDIVLLGSCRYENTDVRSEYSKDKNSDAKRIFDLRFP